MSASGHFGGHLSSAASAFVAEYVAPLVTWDAWTPEKIDRLGKPSAFQTIGSPSDWPESQPARKTQPETQPETDAAAQPTTDEMDG